MTISINGERKTEEDTANILSKSERLRRQTVKAWHSHVEHHFSGEEDFKEAVRRNEKTLERPDEIKTLFTESNYSFSTQVEGRKHRKETLYFIDWEQKKTGRLRQQHKKGPLAKIDKKPKKHLFLEEKRFKELRKWHAKHKHRLPCFCICKERPKNGRYHIEFACDGSEISGWHKSEGKVKTDRKKLKRRIASALRNILGIHSQKPRARDKNAKITA